MNLHEVTKFELTHLVDQFSIWSYDTVYFMENDQLSQGFRCELSHSLLHSVGGKSVFKTADEPRSHILWRALKAVVQYESTLSPARYMVNGTESAFTYQNTASLFIFSFVSSSSMEAGLQ